MLLCQPSLITYYSLPKTLTLKPHNKPSLAITNSITTNNERKPMSAFELRISLVFALASQTSSLSQRLLMDLATETAKYVFPKRFESQNLEEALMAVPDLETVKFKVLCRRDQYEIREVEPYFIAETTMPGKAGFDFNGASQSFNVLAEYLFGKNSTKETMEMTTPVITRKTQSAGEKMEMTTPVITKKLEDQDKWQMSFVMPSKYGANLPLPKDSSVRIKEVPKKVVAVVAFSGMSRRPRYLDQLAGAVKKPGHAGAGPSQKRPVASGAKEVAASAPQSSSLSIEARPASPHHPSRKRRRQFGVDDAELRREVEEEQVLGKKQPARKEKKRSEGPSRKMKGAVILGAEDLNQEIREATSHLVPAMNVLAEAIPPAKIPEYEDLSPEDVVSVLCSQMAKATYLAAKNKDLLLSLLSEGGQAQRLQNLLTAKEAELASRDEAIRNLELSVVEAQTVNKGLRTAASTERANAEAARRDVEAAQAENRILRVEVCSLESKLRAKDEELDRELRRREAELESERDSIRLEGVGDCAEIIPLVLPNLDMGPIHAAIRFCKGEISQEDFQGWLPLAPEAVIDPDPISVAPMIPAHDEDLSEAPVLAPADSVIAAEPDPAEIPALNPEAEPSQLLPEPFEGGENAPVRVDE